MSKTRNNKVSRAVRKAQDTKAKLEAIQVELAEAEREADRVLGEAVRLASTSSRSKWAKHADVTVRDFYNEFTVDKTKSDDESETVAYGEPVSHFNSDYAGVVAEGYDAGQGY